MQPGRKILNLRCDRKISQQDLARASDITPSALSKIESGLNAPRAHIIWRIAQNLGVTVEYLLDESVPYPFSPYSYRQKLLESHEDPAELIDAKVTREEAAYLDALREAHPVAREIALAVPEASVETIRLMQFLIHQANIDHPDPSFWTKVKSLFREGAARAGTTKLRPTNAMGTRAPRKKQAPAGKADSATPRTRSPGTKGGGSTTESATPRPKRRTGGKAGTPKTSSGSRKKTGAGTKGSRRRQG